MNYLNGKLCNLIRDFSYQCKSTKENRRYGLGLKQPKRKTAKIINTEKRDKENEAQKTNSNKFTLTVVCLTQHQKSH